ICFQSFFFSSRRRHTRFSRDWSSDVCSSDLLYRVFSTVRSNQSLTAGEWCGRPSTDGGCAAHHQSLQLEIRHLLECCSAPIQLEIGRASCREREEIELGYDTLHLD